MSHTMSPIRSVAAAQTIPVRGDVSANIEQHVRLVLVAANEGAQVVVFPELSLTGYELDLAAGLAFRENDPRLEPLVAAAAAHSVTLVVGAPVRIESRLHIAAFIMSPDRTLAIHTKGRLGAFSRDVSPDGIVPPAEDTVFAPGDRAPLVRFAGNPAAVGICAESLRPAHPKRAAEQGAKTYLASHFGIPLDLEFRVAVLRGHAENHGMVVVFANYGGPTGGLAASGGSAIWSQTGELLIQLDTSGSGIAFATEDEQGWRARAIKL
jgi:predicted amidohydrolase